MGLTNIQWADYTFNPWLGCRKVAPECANCYIVRQTPLRVRRMEHGARRDRTAPSTWKHPLKWNRQAAGAAARPRVFCLSLGDWLDDEVPIEWLADLLGLIYATPNLDWLLLTKRPQNWSKRVTDTLDCGFRNPQNVWICDWYEKRPPNNVWIGVSEGADKMAALDIPSRVHFLSCEPMLHPMDTEWAAAFDWIIFGGESGHGARACEIEWIRHGVKFCRDNGIAPFVKQMGAHLIHEKYPRAPREMDNFGRVEFFNFKHSHGGDMSEWPEDLRVREFPVKV